MTTETQSVGSATPRHPDILLVDDQECITQLVQIYLQQSGLSNVHAFYGDHTGTKAKDWILMGNKPDLALIDIELNNSVNGVDLYNYLQKHSPKTLVIFMTSFSETSPMYQQAAKTGCIIIKKTAKYSMIADWIKHRYNLICNATSPRDCKFKLRSDPCIDSEDYCPSCQMAPAVLTEDDRKHLVAATTREEH